MLSCSHTIQVDVAYQMRAIVLSKQMRAFAARFAKIDALLLQPDCFTSRPSNSLLELSPTTYDLQLNPKGLLCVSSLFIQPPSPRLHSSPLLTINNTDRTHDSATICTLPPRPHNLHITQTQVSPTTTFPSLPPSPSPQLYHVHLRSTSRAAIQGHGVVGGRPPS